MYKPKKMLVTGAAGFIGSNFVHFALQEDDELEVLSLDKLTYAGNKQNLENLPDESRHLFVQGDICDCNLINKLLYEHSIDTIVHFAAESHVDRSIRGPSDFIQTNIVGTFVLLEAARNYWSDKNRLDKKKCRFHHISTDEVFGDLDINDLPFTEETPYNPSSPYSASKASSDHLVRAYARTYNLPITISNCSNNYGPRQHLEKFIPTIIGHCIRQTSIPIYGNGSNIRDWLYVQDHCEAIMNILNAGVVGETYNIGGNCERDNLSLAKMICSIMDKSFPANAFHEKLITFVTDRPGHDWRYAINIDKIQKDIGWEPKTNIQSALELTVSYYLNSYVCDSNIHQLHNPITA